MITQSMISDLEKAYMQGVLKVREGDTWVEYQSMSEMRVAIDRAKLELNKSKSKVRIVATINGYR